MHEQSIGFTWAQPGDEVGFIENESMSTVAKERLHYSQSFLQQSLSLHLIMIFRTALQLVMHWKT